jgi:glycosyltransferase involved in cell wall biosynthesis
MKILYFYQYFATSRGSWGTRVHEFAKNWVAEGHEVTVVSAIYSKSDLKAKRFIETQIHDGIKVKVVNVLIDNRQPFLKRIFSFLQYMTFSTWFALTYKADVVIASSGPITVGFPGLIARYIRGRKLVFEVRDLWPEGAVELGVLRNPMLIKAAFWFERRCYRASSHIVTLSPGMSADIKKRYSINNVTDVTNAANIQLFSTPKRIETPFSGKVYAIYTGNIGDVNNSFWLLNAARELKQKGRPDITILLIGEGQERETLVHLAANEQLTNFVRLPLMPKEQLVAYVQQAMVSLVPLKGTPILDTSSPNKFFESLAAGVPVVQNTKGWMKVFLEEHNIGFTLDADDAEGLASLLIVLASRKEELKEMGARAKVLAAENFDKDSLSKKMLRILTAVHEN